MLRKEILIKITLIIALFLGAFLIFKALQKPTIYNATLKHVSHTYNRDSVLKNVVWKMDVPYYYRDTINTCRWDASIYNEIKKDYYSGADHKYALFPLFPLFWKLTNMSVLYIGLLNYIFFGLAVLLFSLIFLKHKSFSLADKIVVFVLSLTLPPVVVYYFPYAEGLFTLTFALAIYGLIKKNYWFFFSAIVLFAMTRPIFIVVGVSFVLLDFIYFLKHRNLKHFTKELELKLFPLIAGTGIVFFMFFLNSGSFTKYFYSINKFWNASFSIPEHITDWSTEGYGMNIFTISFILIPAFVVLFYHFIKIKNSPKEDTIPSIFDGNIAFIKEYFFNHAVLYFGGVFLFAFFFQGGSLNGLSRYIIASPFMLIYIYYTFENLDVVEMRKALRITIPLFIVGIYMLTMQPKIDPTLNFNDSGFFTLFLSFFLFVSWRAIANKYIKYLLLFIITLYNLLWITYLYNIYLCNGYIFT